MKHERMSAIETAGVLCMKKFPKFSSLRMRLILLIVVGILPWLVAMVYHFWRDWQEAQAMVIAETGYLTRAIAAEQDYSVHNARNLLQVLATLPELRSDNVEQCRSRLQAIHAQLAGYINIGVTNAHGRLLCAAKGGGQDFSDRDWVREMVRAPRFVVGRYVIGKISGAPILPVAYPILDEVGDLERIVWVSLDAAWLEKSLKHNALAKGTTISVLDQAGIVVARYPPDVAAIGKPYPLAWLVTAIKTGKTEGDGVARTSDGHSELVSFSHLPSSGATGGIYVSASFSVQQLLAGVLGSFKANLLWLGLFTALTLGGAWYLAEYFVLRRVRDLEQTARRIARGDLGARPALAQGKSELSDLARAFDEMAGSLEQSFRQTQRIMEVAPEAIILADASGRIAMVNARTESMFGYTRQELIGQLVEVLVPIPMRSRHSAVRQAYASHPVVREMGSDTLDLTARRKDGTVFPADISLGPIETEQGVWVVAAVRDMSERKRFEEEMLHQATHDALTGLPNRVLFQELLAHGLTQSMRQEKLLAVLFLDLDGFKNINDTLGHATGDELLKMVSQRIAGALRKEDVVARQGGDEFTILLQGIRVVQDISQVAEKLLEVIAQPYVADDREMHVTASIGITVFPFDDNDVASLLRNADTAMYQAKEAGKNTFRFYTVEMNAALLERVRIEEGLRRALQEEELVLYYQPQIDLTQKRVVGVEALIRWRHPVEGLVSPGKFIPVAEETGLIEPIGEWVLRTACRQIMAWRKAGLGDIKVAVNLSARQFNNPGLLDTIRGILHETGVDACPGLLELELTESMVMQQVERHIDTLQRLRAMGICISIDDFGTGYSSLSYLKRFPIRTLKIDQSFVRDLTTDAEDAAIVSAIVMLAHSLKLRVIAEGVETAEQLEALRALGCDEIQGYHFSRPLPIEDLTTFLQSPPAV